MSKTIFYSWQSDLPNPTNRSFIEKAINKAIGEIKAVHLGLEVVIDRDTKDVSGTPDIASTIFSKIDSASIFIADISFINSSAIGKKTPNPNVLVELGYAAKSIGWENIICVFNEDYGNVTDLPFDLRFRRPLSYNVTNPSNKTKDISRLSQNLEFAIAAILSSQSSNNEVNDYIKQQLDRELLTICNHVYKIIYGYKEPFSLSSVTTLLNLNKEDLQGALFERHFLGFTVLKDWDDYKQKIESIINQPFFVHHVDRKLITPIIKVVTSLEKLIVITSPRDDAFTNIDKTESDFEVVQGSSINPQNPEDRYILLKKIPNSPHGIVVDFGSFRQYYASRLLTYQKIHAEHFRRWALSIAELLENIGKWADSTGNEFILDPVAFRSVQSGD